MSKLSQNKVLRYQKGRRKQLQNAITFNGVHSQTLQFHCDVMSHNVCFTKPRSSGTIKAWIDFRSYQWCEWRQSAEKPTASLSQLQFTTGNPRWWQQREG